ncbi:MAG: preprotein translocase subunit SecG [Tissierellia bacterium]|nr:preprotein translocase subunit SecG [Tissierellia bacterium]
MSTLLSVILAIASIVIIISVVMQEPDTSGLGALDGSSNEASWGASRGASQDDVLKRLTIIGAIVFFIAAIVLAVVS